MHLLAPYEHKHPMIIKHPLGLPIFEITGRHWYLVSWVYSMQKAHLNALVQESEGRDMKIFNGCYANYK